MPSAPKLLALALAASLCMPFAAARPAFADEVSDAQAALDQAEERMAQIAEEHAQLEAQVEDLQGQIDDATQGVMDAQAAVQEGRANLGDMMSYEYKTGGITILEVIFGSQNLSDLIDNLQYAESVQEAQAAAIEEQKVLEQQFTEALDDLNAKKDSQMKALAEAEQKSQEAAQVVESAQAQLSKAEDEAAKKEAARLAALQKQAEELKAQQEAAAADQQTPSSPDSGSADEGGDSSSGGDNGSDTGSAGGNGGNSGGSGGSSGGSESGGGEATDPDAGWKTGVASAYGSKSDGTLGAHTATGALVTETSMGVAIPMSWPNYRSYFGRSVEISYGGRTVIAVVNDCGGMGGGSRSLDLQPGVWKALGASSCYDWGVRTVSYRFL